MYKGVHLNSFQKWAIAYVEPFKCEVYVEGNWVVLVKGDRWCACMTVEGVKTFCSKIGG